MNTNTNCFIKHVYVFHHCVLLPIPVNHMHYILIIMRAIYSLSYVLLLFGTRGASTRVIQGYFIVIVIGQS